MLKSETTKSRSNVVTWLFTGCFLIFLMVVVGGITRLTGSGLSITKWKIVTGTLPPLNEQQWNIEFIEYSESPQFQQINSHFGIEEFKNIYWWEYIHRLLGRLIGFVFIIPYLYFLISKQFSKPMIWKTLLLLFMGAFQGFLGWYMVKSGLVNEPNVSHYRLGMHLTTAFLTFGLTFWFALDILHPHKISNGVVDVKSKLNSYSILVLVMLQIIFGAFVAGLDAGLVYNTFPKMDDMWIAESVTWSWQEGGFLGIINSLGGVQFIHRYMAYMVVIVIGFGWVKSIKNVYQLGKQKKAVVQSYNFLALMVLLQFVLGVFTLIYNVPVSLGVIHQVGAFFLFTGSVYLIHRMRKMPGDRTQ